ncbi:S46 family peptidase [Alterisphingorhabdus coralli]|uniref:Dipeptidyl-peptidase n=1 Tax=Alterisphingorhabdus coralli TaxID=3071408 RepID=A0AA97I043_9SPHN|nr:S46 family peptidase [Parasphingorhabdus sp. SCSIO 66989]WOE74507.1 S46 family peptidase [Parasphingorhabdus sp. SCSIO 66989]
MTTSFRARKATAWLAGSALIAIAPAAQAEEGMWTFDAFPTEKVQGEYGWAPDQQWLDRTRAAAVRLTGGCSASFVSPEGLILTNHHCVVRCLQDLSTQDSDLVANGVNARQRSEERTCPGQQAEVVTDITDYTGDITSAIAGKAGAALVSARDARISEIEASECPDRETTRCQVVTLFGGGQYKLYKYRKYSDVRIAWAPEFKAAFFGGDPDNFNFPRYAMDAAFLRAYEDGKPVDTPAHLKWNPRAPQDGEITFVVGNPGSTQRGMTGAQRAYQREVALPNRLLQLAEYRGRLIEAMRGSEERTREGGSRLFGVENSYKALYGRMQALNNAEFAAQLDASEAELKERSAGTLEGDPWGDIAGAVSAYRNFDEAYGQIDSSGGSQLYSYARTLVRAAKEREKPNAEREPRFSDAHLPLTEKRLLDAKPTYPWLEELSLRFWLSKTREIMTTDNPDVQALLGKESPEAMAERLVSGTGLADPETRKALWEGGLAAVEASDDPLIKLALSQDARSHELTEQFEEEYEAPVTAAQAKLTDARFAAYGDSIYPDATFTLRISYGRVTGWEENGVQVPFSTQMGGTYDRATGSDPYELAEAFKANKDKINADATYDFVTTNDIIGGNSGSPVLDKEGAVIGAAFDGNIHSLGGNYGYDGNLNRTVVVSTEAIQQALEVLYPAPELVAELAGD